MTEGSKWKEWPIERHRIETDREAQVARDDLRLLSAAWVRVKGGQEVRADGEHPTTLEEIEKSAVNVLASLSAADGIILHPENWEPSTKGFFKAVLKRAEEEGVEVSVEEKERGLYLVEPHGLWTWQGKKTAIAKGRKIDLSGEWVLVSGKQAYGHIDLAEPEQVSISEFDKRFNEHMVTPEERSRWWPQHKSLWLYKVKTIEKFQEPRPVSVSPGTVTIIRNVEFEDAKSTDLVEMDPVSAKGSIALMPDGRLLASDATGSAPHPGIQPPSPDREHARLVISDREVAVECPKTLTAAQARTMREVLESHPKHEVIADIEGHTGHRRFFQMGNDDRSWLEHYLEKGTNGKHAFSFTQPEGDTVLVKDFVWVVGSAAEGPDAEDVDVLVRSSHQDGQYALQSEGAELAIRKSIDPGKDRSLHFLAHPQGPHQGKAVALADLILRWHDPVEVEIKAAGLRLNLGCGDSPVEGYVNIDKIPGEGVDLVQDVRNGLPYPDSSVAEVRAFHFLEDLAPEERIPVMAEIHRVLKLGGELVFEVPNAGSAGAEMPFHLSHWAPETFQAFAAPELQEAYDLPAFEIVSLETVQQGDIKNIRGRMRPVKGMKAAAIKPIMDKITLPKPAMKIYTELFSPDELWEKWGKDHIPFMAEEKYNGFRSLVQKAGDKVSVYFEDAKEERSGTLPGLVDQLRTIDHDFILDCNVGVEEGGQPWPRIKLMTLTSDKPELGEGKVVATAFDILYWDEDVHDRPFKERRAILEKSVKGVEISEGTKVDSLDSLRTAFKKYAKRPGSEGIVTKTLDAPYPLGEAGTTEWSKIKIAVEVKAIVLETKPTKNNQYGFRGGLLVGNSEFPNKTEFEGKEYIDLGFSFNAPFKASPGDVVTFQVEEIILQENGNLAWLGAKPVDLDKERTQPYAANQVVDIADRGNILQDATKAATPPEGESSPGETRGEAAAKFWAENWQSMMPPSGKGQFSYHHHWRGLPEDATKLDEKALLDTDHSVHGDLRLTASTGDLWGFSVFLGTTEAVRKAGGDRFVNLPADDNLQGSFKLEEPKAWLTIARRSPLVAAPGDPGSTADTYSKFFEIDHGDYETGVWRAHMFEIFLHGEKAKGRYLIEFAPIGGRRVWLIDKPEDQTPYAEKHDLDAVLAELKKKGQKFLAWSKPGDTPVLYNVDTGKPVKAPGIKEAGMPDEEIAVEEDKAGRRVRADKVGVLRDLKDRFLELLKQLAEVVGWADYEDKKPWMPFRTFKTADGSDWLLTWTTNAFKDRDGEIFSTKAIEDYIARHGDEEDKGEFRFWHIPGSKFGTVRWQGMSGRFLVEAGPFDRSPVGDAMKSFFSRYPDSHPDICPEGWGTSHGFSYRAADRADKVYDWFEKRETSVLPRAVAANQFNPHLEVIPVDQKQRDALKLIGGDKLVALVTETGESLTKELEENVEFKAKGKWSEQVRTLAGKVEDKSLAGQLETLAGKIEAAESEYGYPEPAKGKEAESEKAKATLADLGKQLALLAGKVGGDVGDKLAAIAKDLQGAEKAEPGEEKKPEEYPKPKKEKEAEEVVDTKEYVTRTEVADALMVLAEGFAALRNEVKELRKTDTEKIAEKVAETPKASLRATIQSVIGRRETQVDGRESLAKDAPQETKGSTGATGIPLIDSLKELNRAKAPGK